MRSVILAVVFSGLSSLSAIEAKAGVIRSASAVVSAPSPILGHTAALTIDQSGLSSNYVSGVTDFATYIGDSPTHTRSNDPENYLASFDNTPANIDYDLGAAFQIEQLALWNYPFSSSGGILNFSVFTSNVSNFSSSTLVGNFDAADDESGGINSAQVFNLADTNARYLRLRVLTTANGGDSVGFSEVAFDTAAVPEPSSFILLGTGMLCLLVYSRRRKKRSVVSAA